LLFRNDVFGWGMTVSEIVTVVAAWESVLVVAPGPGDDVPEVAWGDVFFYYAPDGAMPTATQPFATIVTKDYPGDELSALHREGVYRVNVHPGRDSFTAWSAVADDDASALDRIIRHPVYGDLGWLAVLNPGEQTLSSTLELLREAYEADRARFERRHASG